MPSVEHTDPDGTRRVPPATRGPDGPGDDRVAWAGSVLVHDDDGSMTLTATELGRCTLLARGASKLRAGDGVTLEVPLFGEAIFIVATVEATRPADGDGDEALVFRFSVTSPLGNDLLARHVREAAGDFEPLPPRAELETVIDLEDSRRIRIFDAA
jgi:hypothetical protein